MEAFSPAELAELFILEQSEINQQFEFWLTITFAVIVAGFAAGEKLAHNLRVVAASLYILSVIVILSRWYYAANDAEMFKSALNDVGVLVQTPWVTLFARLTLVTLGTLAALVFLLKREVYVQSDD